MHKQTFKIGSSVISWKWGTLFLMILTAPYFPLPGPNHVQLNFNPKMQDVKRVLDIGGQVNAKR